MSFFRKLKRAASKAANSARKQVVKRAKGAGRVVARRASNVAKKHGRKLLKRAAVAGVAAGGSFFAGPVAGATLAKLTNEAI